MTKTTMNKQEWGGYSDSARPMNGGEHKSQLVVAESLAYSNIAVLDKVGSRRRYIVPSLKKI